MKILKAAPIICLLASLAFVLSACGDNGGDTMNKPVLGAYTVNTRIADVMSDPAFDGYGRLLFPVQRGYMSGDTLGSLSLTWYSYMNPDETVGICLYVQPGTHYGVQSGRVPGCPNPHAEPRCGPQPQRRPCHCASRPPRVLHSLLGRQRQRGQLDNARLGFGQRRALGVPPELK